MGAKNERTYHSDRDSVNSCIIVKQVSCANIFHCNICEFNVYFAHKIFKSYKNINSILDSKVRRYIGVDYQAINTTGSI